MERSGRHRNAALAALSLLVCDCAIGVREPRLSEPAAPFTAASADPELKLHMKTGELVVLRNWKVAVAGDRLTGDGQAYTVRRERKGRPGLHDVALADVALVESDSPGTVTSAGLGVLIATTTVLGRDHGVLRGQPEGLLRLLPDLLRRRLPTGASPSGPRPRASRSRSPACSRPATSTTWRWHAPAGRRSRS